jgi:2-C-methyl-D-erythritol 4-phosphate cytidylyltransferase
MKKYAIIAAGGWYSVKAFVDAFEDVNIIVVAPLANIVEAKDVCTGFANVTFVNGGASRFQSVKNGLSAVREPSIVFVHDAVRCLVTKDLIQRCYQQSVEKGSAVPSIPVNDSVRLINGDLHRVIDRNSLRIIQTPQTFISEIILPAFAIDDDEKFTDEATVVEASGVPVHLIEGEMSNIKITKPVDILIAEKLIEKFTL